MEEEKVIFRINVSDAFRKMKENASKLKVDDIVRYEGFYWDCYSPPINKRKELKIKEILNEHRVIITDGVNDYTVWKSELNIW